MMCCRRANVNAVVYFLVVVFAIASWVDINGLWVELPILVQALPEGWDLPSYMVVVTQLANIGPLAFLLCKPKLLSRSVEIPIIYGIIGVGAAACMLLALFWDRQSYVGGSLHSTALLTLNFFLAIVDCTSSVVFLPFMAHFKPEYITAFFIGEGFSGLLPGLVALGQGATQTKCVNQTTFQNITDNGTMYVYPNYVTVAEYQTPNFSIETFFYFLFAMLVACGFAFTLLSFSTFAKKEQLQEREQLEESTDFSSPDCFCKYELSGQESSAPKDNFLDAADNVHSRTHLLAGKRRPEISIQKDPSFSISQTFSRTSSSTYVLFLCLTAWINCLTNGALPSIQSYSVLPYGNTPYHLAVTLASIANPLSCFLAFFVHTSSTAVIVTLTVVGSGFGGYCILLAAMSPDPVLVGTVTGDIFVVAAWFLMTFILTYTKVSVASLLRLEGKRALLWCGALTQAGSALGALSMFLLVSIFHVFRQASPCRS